MIMPAAAHRLLTIVVATLFVFGSPASIVVASEAAWPSGGAVGESALDSTDVDCPQGEDCSNPIVPERRDLSVQGVILAGIFLAILVFGLRAIKRQRDEGRRSKLPPIG